VPDPATDERLLVSPLQMALAAASLSNGGARPAPRLAAAIDTPQSGWVILPPQTEPVTAFSRNGRESQPKAGNPRAASLAGDALPGTEWNAHSWYLAGNSAGPARPGIGVIDRGDNPQVWRSGMINASGNARD
jgi:hypothetical protein